MVLILPMRKLRFRGVKQLAQGHETSKGRVRLEATSVSKAYTISPNTALPWEGRKKGALQKQGPLQSQCIWSSQPVQFL